MTSSYAATPADVAAASAAPTPLAAPAAATTRRWQLEDYFDTLEQAERVVKRLRRRGVEATLSLIGGLSVLAYR